MWSLFQTFVFGNVHIPTVTDVRKYVVCIALLSHTLITQKTTCMFIQ